MSKISKEKVENALRSVKLTESATGKKQDAIAAGIIKSITINGADVSFVVDCDTQDKNFVQGLTKACEKEVMDIAGIGKVVGIATASQQPQSARKPAPTPKPITGVKHVIAVAAGKGGVGKSTIAVNIAVSLAKAGYSTGIVDTDIFGPSIGKMLNIKGKPEIVDEKMVPPMSYGVKAMSMALLVDESQATIWRGSMATKALHQLIRMTAWQGENEDELDFLIIDLPPGTSDIHLTIAQNFVVDGTIIVATPQDVALIDIQKSLDMLKKINAPIIGVIENMSYFIDPQSQNKTYIFGKGGVDKLCAQHKLKKLAELSILPEIATASDAGKPIATEENHPAKEVFDNIAKIINNKFY